MERASEKVNDYAMYVLVVVCRYFIENKIRHDLTNRWSHGFCLIWRNH